MGRKARLWSYRAGGYGSSVRVTERAPGGPLYAMVTATAGKGWRKVSLGHRDKNRAIEEAHKLAARRQSDDQPLDRLTVSAMFDLFTRSVLPRKRPDYQEELRRHINLWTSFLGGKRIVETIGPSDWEAFERARMSGEVDGRGNRTEPDDRRPVGPNTIKGEMKTLRAACRRAAIERTKSGGFLLPADPTRGLPLPAEKNPKRPTADSDRFEKLLAVADQVQMRRGWGKKAVWEPSYLPLLLRVAGDSGRRISSILALRWSDWLPEYGASGALRWRAESDKLGREWVVPVSASLAAALKAERARRGGIGELWVFPSPNDATKPIQKAVVTAWLRKAEVVAGLKPMERGAWHAFRRMWACQRKHLPVRDVAAAGGWKDVTVLQGVYQAADLETLEAVVSGGRRVRGILR